MLKRSTWLLVAIVFFAINVATSLLTTLEVGAETGATWMDMTKDPTLDAVATISNEAFIDNVSLDFNPECEDRTYITRPTQIGQTQQTITRCWQSTSMGMVSRGGAYAVAPDDSRAGMIRNRPTQSYFMATPRPNIVFDSRSYTYTTYNRFHFWPTLATTTNSNGTVTHDFSAEETLNLVYESGNNASSYIHHLNYSANGRYATVVMTNLMFRIDLDTKQILRFGAPQPSAVGYNPFEKVSITNDGRYAVTTVTSRNSGNPWMRVYDLHDCQDGEYSYIASGVANCQYRDFTNFIMNSIPNFNTYTMAKFVDNNTFTFYHRSAGDDPTYTQFVTHAPNVPVGGMKYLALGDSFGSGEGAHNYERGTDSYTPKNLCHLSTKSFPYLLNAQLNPESFHSVACSGAVMVNISGGNGISPDDTDATDPFRSNQYEKPIAPNDLGDEWMPGYKPQIEFVADEQNKPNVLTVSITGNDARLAEKIKECLKPGTCFSSYESRVEVANEINDRFYQLVRLYKRLKSTAAPGAKIYAIGYPQVADPEGLCAFNVHLNRDELHFANLFVGQLNTMIKQAAANSGVYFVDVEHAFVGHRMCESEAGSVAVNGITAGNDILGTYGLLSVFGNETYHPNALGHNLYKDAIIAQTNGFTAPMPAPDSSKTKPVIDYSIPLLANTPRDDRTIHEIHYDPNLSLVEDDILFPTTPWMGQVDGSAHSLQVNGTYDLWLNSDPVHLGTFKTDEKGNLTITAEVPSTVPAGFHTLHLYGKNLSGQDIDIYKLVYVAATAEDLDGDGIPNELDACTGVPESGVDSDKDGIDDACDGNIGPAPIEPEIPTRPGVHLPDDKTDLRYDILDLVREMQESLNHPIIHR